MTALAPAIDERPLVRAILAGDESAFADLVRRHSAALLHVARSFVVRSTAPGGAPEPAPFGMRSTLQAADLFV